jgi:hypothetical protein
MHCSSREGGRRPVYIPLYIAYAIRAFAAFRVSNLGRDLGFIRSSRLGRLGFPETWPSYLNYFQMAVGKQCPYNQCIIDFFWPTTNAEFYRKALNPFYIPFKRLGSLKRLRETVGSLPIVLAYDPEGRHKLEDDVSRRQHGPRVGPRLANPPCYAAKRAMVGTF